MKAKSQSTVDSNPGLPTMEITTSTLVKHNSSDQLSTTCITVPTVYIKPFHCYLEPNKKRKLSPNIEARTNFNLRVTHQRSLLLNLS